MLASRGWGVEEFQRASPDFLAACRWLVMVERAVPEYQVAQRAANVPLTTDTPVEVIRAKVAASEIVNDWRPWLFPEDDDG